MNLILYQDTGLTKKELIKIKNTQEEEKFFNQFRRKSVEAVEPFTTTSFKVKMEYTDALKYDYGFYSRRDSVGYYHSLYFFIDEIKQLSDRVVEFIITIDSVMSNIKTFNVLTADTVRLTIDEYTNLPQDNTFTNKEVMRYDLVEVEDPDLIYAVALLNGKEKGNNFVEDRRMHEGTPEYSVMRDYIVIFTVFDKKGREVFYEIKNTPAGESLRKQYMSRDEFMAYVDRLGDLVESVVYTNMLNTRFHNIKVETSSSGETVRKTLVYRDYESNGIPGSVIDTRSPIDTTTNINKLRHSAPNNKGYLMQILQSVPFTIKTIESSEERRITGIESNRDYHEIYIKTNNNEFPIFSPETDFFRGGKYKVSLTLEDRFYLRVETSIHDRTTGEFKIIKIPVGHEVRRLSQKKQEAAVNQAVANTTLQSMSTIMGMSAAFTNPLALGSAAISAANTAVNSSAAMESMRTMANSFYRGTVSVNEEIDKLFKVSLVISFIEGEKLTNFILYKGINIKRTIFGFNSSIKDDSETMKRDYRLYMLADIIERYGYGYIQLNNIVLRGVPAHFRKDFINRLEEGVIVWNPEKYKDYEIHKF